MKNWWEYRSDNRLSNEGHCDLCADGKLPCLCSTRTITPPTVLNGTATMPIQEYQRFQRSCANLYGTPSDTDEALHCELEAEMIAFPAVRRFMEKVLLPEWCRKRYPKVYERAA